MEYLDKNIGIINDMEYDIYWNLYTNGDNYLTSGYRLNDLKMVKAEYMDLLNEYKERIGIFLMDKRMQKAYMKITNKKYVKNKLNLDDMDDYRVEDLYLKMYDIDNGYKNK